jgi:aryl-alcohol dehydrogenase-like predicted oxidoreductase
MLDQGVSAALWGARHPDQLRAIVGTAGWSVDTETRSTIDRILRETVTDPVGPEFMAPPQRS